MSITSAVIVCAHRLDRLALTAKCVDSVLNGDHQPNEVFVVVDNNPELYDELVHVMDGERVRVIRNPGDGAAASRSAGVELTKSDVCFFIDDDAWAEKQWLSRMIDVFRDPRIAGAGGRVVPEWDSAARTLPAELLWVVGATYRGHPDGVVPITRPIGANMAARTHVLREIGGFPAEFGPRGGKKVSSNEELALFTMITERWGRDSVVYVPSSVVHHHVPAGRTSWKYLIGRCWAEGTSKADIRSTFRGSVMAHDQEYAQSTLIPAIGTYFRSGIRDAKWQEMREGIQCAVALGVTGVGYLARLAHLA